VELHPGVLNPPHLPEAQREKSDFIFFGQYLHGFFSFFFFFCDGPGKFQSLPHALYR
jgi:hypothetical protein